MSAAEPLMLSVVSKTAGSAIAAQAERLGREGKFRRDLHADGANAAIKALTKYTMHSCHRHPGLNTRNQLLNCLQRHQALATGSHQTHRASSHSCINQHRKARVHVSAQATQLQVEPQQETRPSTASTSPPGLPAKPRVVILGSGWGAISFLKGLPDNISQQYDITLVSPRSFFLFTALLPQVTTGSLEERSITESIRKILRKKGKYYEAAVTDVDPNTKVVSAAFPQHAGLEQHSFQVPYDILILSVGSVNNTFGIKGVKEHAHFFKSIADANALRQRVCECFERAALPDTSEQEKRRLLSFIVVGGGPTGVEVAAELFDLICEDLTKYYPDLRQFARVKLVELQDHVLSTYDRQISDYTSQLFSRNGIDLLINTKVSNIAEDVLTVVDNVTGAEQDIPYGACVWATGVAMHPLIRQLQKRLPEGSQTHWRSIVTDGHLQVKGSNGSIYALGDAATIDQPKAVVRAKELFQKADKDRDGKLTFSELRQILWEGSKEYSHLAEHARFLDGRAGAARFGGLVKKQVAKDGGKPSTLPMDSIDEDTMLDEAQFLDLIKCIDKGLRALPATGQVAGQEGTYLGKLFAKQLLRPGEPLPPSAKPFRYNHRGSLAYVGGDKAVMEMPRFGVLKGFGAGLAWRGFETWRQVSWRNRVLVTIDFFRSKIFGRDVEFGDAELPNDSQ